MTPVGFRQYNHKDKYAGRKATNKVVNLIWKVVVVGIVLACLAWTIKFLMPWQKEVNSAINGPTRYEGVPSFWR
jgi:hypothetical protein